MPKTTRSTIDVVRRMPAPKVQKCREVGCSKIVNNSVTLCNSCRKPMCRSCKNNAVANIYARGRCDYCCWDEIT